MEAICNLELCTGCSACSNICPQTAISMQPDEKGFLRPVIDQTRCIDCGLCKRVCQQIERSGPTKEGKIYAALAINDELRERSSSGGIFSLLAEKAIQAGGVVFGAAFDNELHVRHVVVDSLKDLDLLRGSKYVQSEIGYCYKEAKEYLENGKSVLFSGTPCQIDALKHYLGKRYEKLLTVDILCHGVPSPAVLQKFVESKERSCNKRVESINFRDKDPGWSAFSTTIRYEDGTKEIDNSYYYFFVRDFCIRESCSRCLYSTTKRVGDITLGDFWGYQESAPEHIEDDDKGISLVTINSEKGEKAFQRLKGKADFALRSKDNAIKYNKILVRPFLPNEQAMTFWHDFPILSWDELVEKYEISREKKKDWISEEDRHYYSKPYKQRHTRHLIHCAKEELLKIIRR